MHFTGEAIGSRLDHNVLGVDKSFAGDGQKFLREEEAETEA